jgi:hypothetical protein
MATFCGTDFTFNNISSTPTGLQLVRTESGLVATPVAGGKNVHEEYVPYRDKPYFYISNMQPLEVTMSFMITATPNAWTDAVRQQVFDWLYSPRQYCDFISSDNLAKVYKIIFTSPLEFNTISLTEGYFTLSGQMYPHAYTILTSTPVSVTSTPTNITIINEQNVRNYDNTYYYYPIIYADLTGAASSIKIVNTSDSNRVFEITGLDALEELYIDNELKIINSSVTGANRFATLTSKQWLRLIKGSNVLRIDTTCDLVIQCQYPILS